MNTHLATALNLAPVIERVHGAHHPELTRVRELTERIPHAAGATETDALFRKLRAETNDYAIPNDACEAFTETYRSLAAADKAHQARV